MGAHELLFVRGPQHLLVTGGSWRLIAASRPVLQRLTSTAYHQAHANKLRSLPPLTMNGAGVAAGSRRRHAQLMPIADGSSTNRHAVASGGPPAAQPRPPSLGAVRALLILNVQVGSGVVLPRRGMGANSIACVWQNDFFQGGAMPLPDAERILPIIARLRRTKKFDVVIISGTRHLPQHRCRIPLHACLPAWQASLTCHDRS